MRKTAVKLITVAIAGLSIFAAVVPDAICSDAAAEAYLEQATRCLKKGELNTARRMLEKAAGDVDKGVYGDKVYTSAIFTNLGECYRRLAGTPDYASNKQALLKLSQNAFRKALEIKEAAYGTNAVEIAKVLEDLGNAYYDDDNCLEAEAMFRKALQIRERNEGPDGCNQFLDFLRLGDVLSISSSTRKEAEEFYKRAMNVCIRCNGPNDALVGKVHQQMALLDYERDRLTAAAGHYDKAVTIFTSHGAATKTNLADCKKVLRPIAVDMFAIAERNYRKQLDGKTTAGPELIPAIRQLTAAARRLDRREDVAYLTAMANELVKRRLAKLP
jgi:tetratricopeptide (TPR) repeat protein